MKAIIYSAPGDTDVIRLGDVPAPVAGPRQIRVRVHAAGLNRADILQRKGRYPAPPGWPADIPGLEYAGEVDSLGDGATRWKRGDRVMGLVGGGAHAEFVVVHEDEAIGIPAHLAYSEAAAIPEAFLTAWDALVTRGRLQAGERVLIHAVGSGVGTAAVQLAKRLGAVTAGTSRSAEKLARAAELGLDEPIATGGDTRPYPTVNVILDVLGGPAFAANLEALAPRGRLVMLGFLQGPKADLSLEPILRKRLEIIGSVMRTRVLEERMPLVREFNARVLPMFEPDAASGRPQGSPVLRLGPLRPILGAVYPMHDIAAAHAAMERDENFGKLVIVM